MKDKISWKDRFCFFGLGVVLMGAATTLAMDPRIEYGKIFSMLIIIVIGGGLFYMLGRWYREDNEKKEK